MILSKLHLENFKRYTSFDIEFGEGPIGNIGKNGSGKIVIPYVNDVDLNRILDMLY